MPLFQFPLPFDAPPIVEVVNALLTSCLGRIITQQYGWPQWLDYEIGNQVPSDRCGRFCSEHGVPFSRCLQVEIVIWSPILNAAPRPYAINSPLHALGKLLHYAPWLVVQFLGASSMFPSSARKVSSVSLPKADTTSLILVKLADA